MAEMSLQHVDLSSLNQEEALALQQVLLRQKEFEELNGIRRRDLRLELIQLEQRLALAEKSATDKELCRICFKTKVADCLRLKCRLCCRKTCSRCGNTEIGRTGWMCQLCSKKRRFLTCTGDWYVGNEPLYANAQYFLDKLEESNSARMEDHRAAPSRTRRFSLTNEGIERLPRSSSRGSVGEGQDTYSLCNVPEYLSLPVNEPRRCSLSELSIESEFTSCFSVSTQSDSGMPALNVVEATDTENESDASDSSGRIHTKKMQGRRKQRTEDSRDSGRPMIERLTLSRETLNQKLASRDAAFGVRVVGGKTSVGGIMGAFVVGIIPGTKAQELLSIGDQVIEWNNMSLVDATFEGTLEAIVSSPDEVSIVVCHVSKTDQSRPSPRPSCSQIVSDAIEKRRQSFAREARSCTSQDELLKLILNQSQDNVNGLTSRRSSVNGVETNVSEKMNFWSHSSDNDRRSRLKISLWHDPGGFNLIIKILQAQRLPLGTTPGDELPNSYAVVNLLPIRNVSTQFRTDVKFHTQSPVWNLTFIYSNITEEELSSRSLEVTLWSERKARRHRFLGKIKVDLVDRGVLSSIPQWYYLEKYWALDDAICIPVNRRHTLCSGEDVTKLFVGTNERRDQPEGSKLRRTTSSILGSYQSRRNGDGELLSDLSKGIQKRRKTNSIRWTNRAGSLSPSLFSSHVASRGKNYRPRYDSENVFKFGINAVGKSLAVPLISSAPTTPSCAVFDKCPRSDFSSLAFEYAFNSKTERSLLSGSSGSSQAQNSHGLTFNFDFEDGKKAEDIEERGHQDKVKEERAVPAKSEEQNCEPETEKTNSVKQKLVQKISFNLRESSDTESKEHVSFMTSGRSSLLDRSRPSSVRQQMSEESFMFGEDPEYGTIGPSQIRCHDYQDLGYLRLGLSLMCGVLEVDVIRGTLHPTSTFQPDTYVKTYLILNDKKLFKRKSSTVRQDLNPVYNCKVKYAARDVDNKILNVCVWQKQSLFGRNVPIGEVNISLERLNISCKFVAWYKLFPLPKLS